MSSQAFSAPGKALLAGGYLVLDPQYKSYVTALSSRMHAVLHSTVSTNVEIRRVKVSSPQFKEGEWVYNIKGNDYYQSGAINEINERRNPFLEATISTVLTYIQPKDNFDIDITIYSDSAYHSQDGTTVSKSNNGQKKFLYHTKPIMEVPKTGMGSSAGLVTVVTTALLAYFNNIKDIDESTKNIIHNCSQIAHCYAQKKIGSGFDVAAAVFGSIIYKRFQPSLIENILSNKASNEEVQQLVNSSWDFVHDQCALPPHIRLLMGDIEGGSETPKLVSKVLQWKKDKPDESDPLYKALDTANQKLIGVLSDLHNLYKQDPVSYTSHIDSEVTTELSQTILDIRHNLQKLTKLSGAEIEPETQTKLLDNCRNLQGSFGGVVPGAGGYDAICLLVKDDSVNTIVRSTATNPRFQNVTWLNLHEEAQGVRTENVVDYDGLK
ncbi:Phosphomevalonate kinase [Scheffersomyces amazonensis]|uniref:Phosphomevalonate kinase n=1 Tax=Scheffersomyces amazonensis TaxID=1078765 RepID=UPI00315D2949